MADKCGGEMILPVSDDEILALAHHLEGSLKATCMQRPNKRVASIIKPNTTKKSSKVDLLM